MAGDMLSALEMLRCLARDRVPRSARELAEMANISRPTAYRMLQDLVKAGWLHASERPMRFEPSFRVAELGILGARQTRVREVLLAHAIELSRIVNQRCAVAFYDHGEVFWTDGVQVLGQRVHPSLRYHRAPAASTASGKILLALQPAAERTRVISQGLPRYASSTRTEPAEIAHDIDQCRLRRYGYSEAEFHEDTAGLAVAITDTAGTPLAALSIGVRRPVPFGFIEQAINPLRTAASLAAAELGNWQDELAAPS